ncbi:unnamed protein product, partial [Rotaria sp. Silwood2]
MDLIEMVLQVDVIYM